MSNVLHVSIPNFSFVSVKEVQKLSKDVDSKKATEYDKIPPQTLEIAADKLAPPLANLINLSITKSNFPMDLKNRNYHNSTNARTAWCLKITVLLANLYLIF